MTQPDWYNRLVVKRQAEQAKNHLRVARSEAARQRLMDIGEAALAEEAYRRLTPQIVPVPRPPRPRRRWWPL